ncbi:hypothetical protein NF700_09585 [Sphingomonadaceae bacterium OTU29MARTA1]|nr:hypothetical protein NF700_09585 [Sphingomonadaceae bacterium OTU29MARTA1]
MMLQPATDETVGMCHHARPTQASKIGPASRVTTLPKHHESAKFFVLMYDNMSDSR